MIFSIQINFILKDYQSCVEFETSIGLQNFEL